MEWKGILDVLAMMSCNAWSFFSRTLMEVKYLYNDCSTATKKRMKANIVVIFDVKLGTPPEKDFVEIMTRLRLRPAAFGPLLSGLHIVIQTLS